MASIVYYGDKWSVCTIDNEGNSTFPHLTIHGAVAYDNPYRVSKKEKKETERIFTALAGHNRWAIWEMILHPQMGKRLEHNFEYRLVRMTNEHFPRHTFFSKSVDLGYRIDHAAWDLAGGWFSNSNGDCLVCRPARVNPWEDVEGREIK